jgi:hypothetical protein
MNERVEALRIIDEAAALKSLRNVVNERVKLGIVGERPVLHVEWYRPNEKEVSYRHRGRAMVGVKKF